MDLWTTKKVYSSEYYTMNFFIYNLVLLSLRLRMVGHVTQWGRQLMLTKFWQENLL